MNDEVTTFERLGLLDGLAGRDREARLELLWRLTADGYSTADLKRAAGEGRLGLLPVERALSGEARHTPRAVAEQTGLPLDFLLAMRQAIGIARPEPDEPVFDEEDLETARTFARIRAAGVPEEGMLEVARVMGRGLAQVTEAMRMVFARALAEQGMDEPELALRNAEAVDDLVPLISPLMDHTLRLHFRDQVRNQQYGGLELGGAGEPGVRQVYVGFADVVGFTRLGERIEIVEVGRMLEELTALAQDALRPPVRMVKTIGDAVMFVSPTPAELIETVLTLTERVEEAGDSLPAIRSGLAAGAALSREGDWYGRPVNLASRATGVARPGSVLATQEVRDTAGDAYQWSPAGEFRLRGFKHRVPLLRVRRLPT